MEQLPIELSLHICGFLDYFTLKKLRLVSKSFDQLLMSSELDNVLFRLPSASRPEPPDAHPRIHPFLAKLGSFVDYHFPPNVSFIAIRARHSDKSWWAVDTSIANEPATLPPKPELGLVLMHGSGTAAIIRAGDMPGPMLLTSEHDMPVVTVGDVLAGLAEFTNKDYANGGGNYTWKHLPRLRSWIGLDIDRDMADDEKADPAEEGCNMIVKFDSTCDSCVIQLLQEYNVGSRLILFREECEAEAETPTDPLLRAMPVVYAFQLLDFMTFDDGTTMAAQHPAHSLSPLELLPAELWLEICLYLDYFTLKKLYLLSKSFHRLLAIPELDEILFRHAHDKLEGGRSASTTRVHPFLESLGSFTDYSLPKDVSAIMIRGQRSDKLWKFVDTSLLHEPATLPPVSALDLVIMRGYASVSVRANLSTPLTIDEQDQPIVTVGRVMARLAAHVNGLGRYIWHNVGSMSLGCRFVGWEMDAGSTDRGELLVNLVANFDVGA